MILWLTSSYGGTCTGNQTLVARITWADGWSGWFSTVTGCFCGWGFEHDGLDSPHTSTRAQRDDLALRKCIRFRGQIINWRQLAGKSKGWAANIAEVFFSPINRLRVGESVRNGWICRVDRSSSLINVTEVNAEIEHQTHITNSRSFRSSGTQRAPRTL